MPLVLLCRRVGYWAVLIWAPPPPAAGRSEAARRRSDHHRGTGTTFCTRASSSGAFPSPETQRGRRSRGSASWTGRSATEGWTRSRSWKRTRKRPTFRCRQTEDTDEEHKNKITTGTQQKGKVGRDQNSIMMAPVGPLPLFTIHNQSVRPSSRCGLFSQDHRAPGVEIHRPWKKPILIPQSLILGSK